MRRLTEAKRRFENNPNEPCGTFPFIHQSAELGLAAADDVSAVGRRLRPMRIRRGSIYK